MGSEYGSRWKDRRSGARQQRELDTLNEVLTTVLRNRK